MVFQAVPKTVQLTVRHVGHGSLAGSRAQWSIYAWNNGFAAPNPSVNLFALQAALDAWIDAEYLGLLSSEWNVQDTLTKDLSVQGGVTLVGVQNEDGLRAGEPVPPNCACWLKFTGEGGSLPIDGGAFWPVGVESDIEGNDFLSTFITSVNAAMSELQGAIEASGSGTELRIVSRSQVEGSAVRNARTALRNAIAASRRDTALTNPVVAFAARPLVASQRDRRGT